MDNMIRKCQHIPASIFAPIYSVLHRAVYVIFGATGGIGSALATRLSKQPNASLVLAAESEDAIKQIGDVGGNAEHHVVDAQKFDEACLSSPARPQPQLGNTGHTT